MPKRTIRRKLRSRRGRKTRNATRKAVYKGGTIGCKTTDPGYVYPWQNKDGLCGSIVPGTERAKEALRIAQILHPNTKLTAAQEEIKVTTISYDGVGYTLMGLQALNMLRNWRKYADMAKRMFRGMRNLFSRARSQEQEVAESAESEGGAAGDETAATAEVDAAADSAIDATEASAESVASEAASAGFEVAENAGFLVGV